MVEALVHPSRQWKMRFAIFILTVGLIVCFYIGVMDYLKSLRPDAPWGELAIITGLEWGTVSLALIMAVYVPFSSIRRAKKHLIAMYAKDPWQFCALCGYYMEDAAFPPRTIEGTRVTFKQFCCRCLGILNGYLKGHDPKWVEIVREEYESLEGGENVVIPFLHIDI